MDKKKVIDHRRVKLENINKKDYIGFLEGRPVRDTVIGAEDMINLRIALNTTKTIDELIKIL